MLVGFIIGLFVGSAFGMLVSALLVASQDNDIYEDY